MIPVYQTLTTLNDGRGNCFIACIASLLERPLRELPDLASHMNSGEFYRSLEDWLIPQGLFINHHVAAPKGWSVAGVVQFPSGLPHAVVAFNGAPVHDPFPLGGLLADPTEFYTIDPISPPQRNYCDARLFELGVRP